MSSDVHAVVQGGVPSPTLAGTGLLLLHGVAAVHDERLTGPSSSPIIAVPFVAWFSSTR